MYSKGSFGGWEKTILGIRFTLFCFLQGEARELGHAGRMVPFVRLSEALRRSTPDNDSCSFLVFTSRGVRL